MNPLFYPIIVPFIAGALCLISPRRLREAWAIVGSLAAFILTINIFITHNALDITPLLRIDTLSKFILLAVGLFGFLVALYSLKLMKGKARLREYYTYLLWTIGASCGALLSNNLILLLCFWGFLGLTLYLLIGIGGGKAAPAAKKTFIIVGGSDALMLLGIIIIYHLTSTFQMDKISINLINSINLSTFAFLCLAIAAFAKAGAMPLHTWIPDCAEKAPIPVTAFLPASLDKLLGIYLLARISLHLFELKMATAMSLVLLVVGAVTVIAAVMMALAQSNLKRMLGYLAVSSAGYMLLGLGTGNPVGVTGGLFYMLNSAICMGCLFIACGGVELKTKTTDLDELGGLAKAMPITFVTCLVAALAISGVPPFNGFVSKWMIYQGIIELGKGGDKLWIIWLVAAMFGSALTLASFMKVIHATFLGQRSEDRSQKTEEVHWTMWVPMVVLAGLCVIFGVFAHSIPLKHLILPSIANIPATEEWLGWWQPGPATLLIIIGIGVGAIIYWLGNLKGLREDTAFIGGEVIPDEHRVTGVNFYQTIQEMQPLKAIYKKSEAKAFDIYDQGRFLVFFFTKGLRKAHTGILTTYFSWFLVGLLILIYILR